MIFDEERQAIDWIFRYGNEALARIEGFPLNEIEENDGINRA